MDEKKIAKISLSTFFLILAIIVIIIMSYFLYKFYNEKTTESQKVTELTAEINGLQSTTNNLKEKFDAISNTLNSNNTDNTNTNNNTNTNTNTTINTNASEKKENESIENNTNTTNSNNKSVKYEFSSADNAAARGYPKILKVYDLTENELDFDYNSGFDFTKSTIDRKITGIARANAEQLYEFEENVSGHQYQLIFEFNENKDTVKVYEYDNGKEIGWINLWR